MELAGDVRVRRVNDHPVRADGRWVLYWMIAARRTRANFGLDRAIAWAHALTRPLIVLEALRLDYPFASDRFHRFVLDGMRDNEAEFRGGPVRYYPYVESEPGAGKGLLAWLGQHASVIVTDEYPCFFLPRAVAAAGRQLPVRLEAVDSNGLLPLAIADRAFTAAVHFRRHVQRHLRDQLKAFPEEVPLEAVDLPGPVELSGEFEGRWPRATAALLGGDRQALAALAIDHGVPVAAMPGGSSAARRALDRFVSGRLSAYGEGRNHPDDDGTSRLSPYLHFGHLGPHQVFTAVMRREDWSVGRLGARATGLREGWWGVGPGAEAFLDQLVTWRELAFNTCWMRPGDYNQYASLPAWARETLEAHAGDPRPVTYSVTELEQARTHDELWNAAQRQLLREGWFHNYLRMLWGKKILEWSPSPREALQAMQTIMDRWSLDGRDPNSYAGYFWTLGRYDRPWPERPIYGTVRSMSSESTRKKVKVKAYLERYGSDAAGDVSPRSGLLPL
ncbi:MAG: hypothetical protein AB7I04_25545 [Pseudomonadales bacterium]